MLRLINACVIQHTSMHTCAHTICPAHTYIIKHAQISSHHANTVTHVHIHTQTFTEYTFAKYLHKCPDINSPLGALVCHPALFPMRACCALWLAVIDDGHGEADHLGGPIYTGRKSNQLR